MPRPKTCWACWVRSSSSSFGAWLMKAVLQERAKLALNVPSLISNFLSFWNFQPPYVKYFGHGCALSAEARPLSISSEDGDDLHRGAGGEGALEGGVEAVARRSRRPGSRRSRAASTTTDDLAFLRPAPRPPPGASGSSVSSPCPGVPLLSSSRVLSERLRPTFADFPRTTRSSMPALPPGLLAVLLAQPVQHRAERRVLLRRSARRRPGRAP